MRLTGYERETIINFNEAEEIAYIFTYNKSWQRHLESKLSLKPTMDNRYGGKEYEISKKRIRPPRAPKTLSVQTRKSLADNLALKRHLRVKNANILAKSGVKNVR